MRVETPEIELCLFLSQEEERERRATNADSFPARNRNFLDLSFLFFVFVSFALEDLRALVVVL